MQGALLQKNTETISVGIYTCNAFAGLAKVRLACEMVIFRVHQVFRS